MKLRRLALLIGAVVVELALGGAQPALAVARSAPAVKTAKSQPTSTAYAHAMQKRVDIAGQGFAAEVDTNPADSHNLSRGGGPILQTTTNYVIWWSPKSGPQFSASYQSLIRQFFGDISNSGIYNVMSQYDGSNGFVTPVAGLADEWTDTTSFPAGEGSTSKPLQDQDIQGEINKVIALRKWPVGDDHIIYYVFLPQNVQECNNTFSQPECTFTNPTPPFDKAPGSYCAYHGSYTAAALKSDINYAVMPDADSLGCTFVSGPNPSPSGSPNDQKADEETNVLSHEYFESVTDVKGTAWTDPNAGSDHTIFSGFEVGDKCNAFAGVQGSDKADIHLNGHPYLLQMEWSNSTHTCVLPDSEFLHGDVFVSVSNGKVQHRSSDGLLKDTLDTGTGGFTTGMAFDQQNNLYVTDFGSASVTRFSQNGQRLGTFGSGFSSSPESILFDRAGNAYIGSESGDVQKFDKDGKPLQTFSTGRSDWIELGPDQCTLYYTSEGENGGIQRFDVCKNQSMSDFVARSTLDHPFALRLLPSGGMLVADSSVIRRFDSDGKQIGTYDYQGNDVWFALNLDPDGTSFYSADSGTASVVKFDITSSKALLQYNTGTGSDTVFGVVISGELTQGAGAVLFGTVKDSGGGAVGGSLVQACPHGGGSCFEATADPGGAYNLSGLTPGNYDLAAFPPTGARLAQAGVGPVQLAAGQSLQENFVLKRPGSPPSNVSISPLRGTIDSIPIVDFGHPFTVSITGCPNGTADYHVNPFLSFVGSADGTLDESPKGSGKYVASITPPFTWFGPADVTISLTCPDGKRSDVTFTVWIDPSGRVVTETGSPVVGATVTLSRSDGPLGPFAAVPNGSAIMSPMNRANPDMSQSDGGFGWDVIGGYYRVRAQKAGCSDPSDPSHDYVDSDVLQIPPPRADLQLTLRCPLVPVEFTLAGQAGQSAIYATGVPKNGGTEGKVYGAVRGQPVVGVPVTEAGLTTLNGDKVLVVRFKVGDVPWELRFRNLLLGLGSIDICGPLGCETGTGFEFSSAGIAPSAFTAMGINVPNTDAVSTTGGPGMTTTTLSDSVPVSPSSTLPSTTTTLGATVGPTTSTTFTMPTTTTTAPVTSTTSPSVPSVTTSVPPTTVAASTACESLGQQLARTSDPAIRQVLLAAMRGQSCPS